VVAEDQTVSMPTPPPVEDEEDAPRMVYTGEPDIRRAWNFFYGRTLPRREVEDEDENGMPLTWRKLEPVEVRRHHYYACLNAI
jgi:hypothetical protein